VLKKGFIRAILSLGSNQGDRKTNILNAINILKRKDGIRIIRLSSIYETVPEGVNSSHPDYLNAVVMIETNLLPRELINLTELIEKQMGRKDKGKLLPRIIDIDILFYEDRIIRTSKFEIPHPGLHKRFFVLFPLKEICDDFVHPLFNKKPSEMIKDLMKGDGKNIKLPRVYNNKNSIKSVC